MRKFLVFDADRSLSVLGGPQEQKEIFGFTPITVTDGLDQVQGALAHFVTKEERPIVDEELRDILDPRLLPKETFYPLNEKAREIGMAGVIIDTLSVIGQQAREGLVRQRKQDSMDLQLWGIYGDKMMRFGNLLKNMDFHVIATCHVARDSDENGGPIDVPGVKGSAKHDLARYFDVVAYTRVERGREGVKFSWQLRPDNRRPQAKDRKECTADFAEQDISAFLDAYERMGLYLKMLIVGESGQGKSTSLSTINGRVQLEKAA